MAKIRTRARSPRILRAGVAVLATLALATVGVVLPLESARANTMTVGCGATRNADLVEAIETANRLVGGVLTVTLTAGCTYALTTIYRDPYGASEGPNAFAVVEPGFSGTSLVVEGQGATITRSSGERFRFFDIHYTATVTLKNLTLTGGASPHGSGSARWGSPGDNGGAILNGGNLTLDGVTITGNVTGAGENGDGTTAIDGYGGGEGGRGGGIYNGGTLTIRNSQISNNVTGGGGNGGGALGNGGPGGSSGDGGGIYNAGSMLITTSVVSGNGTGNAGSGGGAIDSGPSGYRGSGAGIAASGTTTVTRSLFSGNITGGFAAEGGAIAMNSPSGRVSIEDSTFDSNTAYRGGALYLTEGQATIRRSTFTRNDANGGGDRITGDVAAMDRGATMTFANVLMDDNDPSQVDCNLAYIGPEVSYTSLGGLLSDENNGCGTNTYVADPKLEALAFAGGPTRTQLPRSDSPVLGAGVAAYCGTVDQRGVSRPASGCDVGAVERVPSLTPGVISGPALAAIGQARSLSASTSGGTPLAYRWSVTGVPATLSSTTAASPTVTFTSGFGTATVRVNVRVANSSDAESVDLAPLTVLVPPAGNTAPTVAWTGSPASTANEGSSRNYAYTASDPQGDAITTTPSCGSGGTISGATFAAGVGAFTCTFPNGPTSSTVSVNVADVWTAASSISQAVTIAEIAPTIAVTGATTANEGSVVSYSYTIHEPGSDVFTPLTTCAGTGATKVGGSDMYVPGGHDTAGSFQCRWGSGPASTAATVTANGGSGSTSITVSNVAPSVAISHAPPVAIGGSPPLDENGATLTTYRFLLNATDPGDQASLQYVVGSASCGGAGVGVVVSADLAAVVCRFANGPGTAQITAQVRDPDGATSTGGGKTVSVVNVAPTVTISQPTGPVAEGSPVSYSLIATDPGIDPLTVTAPSGCTADSVNTSTPGKLTATITCVYPDGPQTYSRTVTVGDGVTTGSAVISGQQVVDSHPSIAASFTTTWVYQHTTATLTLGAITDAGPDTVTAIRVNWGDGEHTDYAWPVAGGQVSHLYDTTGWFYPTIDLIDEDGTHANRGPHLLMPAYDVSATVNLNVPASAVEGVPTTITFTVNEDFAVDYAHCYMDYSESGVPFFVAATNIITTARGGSFVCTWPQAGRDNDVYLGIVGSGWTSKRIHIDNARPVVTWDDPAPLTVTEDGSTWVRFPFHASDAGTLGLAVRSFPLTGGHEHMWGCGSGNPTRGNSSGGAIFDNQTGTGYLDCLFVNGPQSAEVWLTMTDFIGDTSIYRTVTVLNGAPSVTLHGPSEPVAEGSTVDFSYDVSDPGADTVTVLSRSCGPGGALGTIRDGGFLCTYEDGPNSALASITVSDGLAAASDSAAVQVTDVAPTGQLWGGQFYDPDPGHEYSLTLANFVDPGDDDVDTVIVDWGDGSTSFVSDGSTNFGHQYQGIGFHTISVSVVNDDGEFPIGTKQVQDVDHVFPVWTPHGDQTIERNTANGAYFWPDLDATDDRGLVSLGCYPGPYFHLVSQPMECYAVDDAGNWTWDYWTLHVVDTVLPVLTPAQTQFEATSTAGAVVWYGVHVNDIGLPYPQDQQSLTCDVVNGSLLPIGPTPVHCSATDDGGNTGTVDFTITVADTVGPAITVPADLTASATGPTGATVTYVDATAYDAIWGAATPSCTPASGSTFPLGPTTVTCSATDGAGITSSATFTVTVVDDVKPIVTTSGDLLIEPTGATGAIVDYAAATAHDAVDGDLDAEDVQCAPASGTLFGLGATLVTCTATDAHNNVGSTSFTVTVQDEAAPVLPPPASIGGGGSGPIGLIVEAEGPDGAHVTYEEPVATDVVDGVLPVDCTPAPGSLFELGTTLVTCTAVDSNLNTGTLVFPITVVDTTAPALGPLLAPPATEATSVAGAVVSFALPTATDLVDGTLTASCTPASGSTFLIGTTTVTCGATDAHSNPVSATFVVTVVDTTKPVLHPTDLRVGGQSDAGSEVDFLVLATDEVDGEIPAACDYDSGDLFPADIVTTVSCSATDVNGNTGTATFTVDVYGAIFTQDEAAGSIEAEVSRDIFEVGDYVMIDEGGPDEEVRLVEDLGSIIVAPLGAAHPAGTIVYVIGSAPGGDTSAPVITITQPAPVARGAALTVAVSCTDAGVGVQACIVPALPTLSLGEHVVTIRAWDRNGNASTAELRYRVVAPGTAGLAYTGGGVGPVGSIALLLLLAGVCLLAYRRWSAREVW